MLLVEDDRDIAAMYAMSLELAGFDVRHVDTAAVAVTTARDWVPDIALIDIGLPDGSGIDVLEALAEDPGIPPVAVAMFTNFDDPALIEQARSRGAAAYFVKSETSPVKLPALLRSLLS